MGVETEVGTDEILALGQGINLITQTAIVGIKQTIVGISISL